MAINNVVEVVDEGAVVIITLTFEQAAALATQLGRMGSAVGQEDQLGDEIQVEDLYPIYALWDELAELGYDESWNDYVATL